MLIDLIIFRAAMARRTPDQSFEARPRDFVALPSRERRDDTLGQRDGSSTKR